MEPQTLENRVRPGCVPRIRAGAFATIGLAALVAVVSGCNHTETEIPEVRVRTVDAYGVTLDEDASPQQVAYVLLRSIADDYAAARAKDFDAQRQAQELTFALAAPSKIEQRLLASANQLNPGRSKESLGPDRDKKLFKTVHYWAPIVGHYVASFADIDLETLVRDSWVTITPDGRTAHVYYPVAHDPGETDLDKAETATISIEMVPEQAQAGGPEYWRVARVQFLGRQFTAPKTPYVVQAYGMTLDDSATPAQVAAAMLRSLEDLAAAEQSGARDERASAMYRVFHLAASRQARAVAGQTDSFAAEGGDRLTRDLVKVVGRWLAQVQPLTTVASDSTAIDPARMQEANASTPGTVRVVCSPPQGSGVQEDVSVDLVRQQVEDKAFWRVMNVTGQEASPAAATQAAALN